MIYLSIGSNIISKFGNRFDNIQKSISLISKFATIDKISNFYETPSYPNRNLPKFINIALRANSHLKPELFLKEIKLIEKKMGRIKKIKNDSRVCDIDIIDFKGIISDKRSLELPHPKSHKRNFVLYPLIEIAPNWFHPILNKNIRFLIKKLSRSSHIEITRVKENDINI